MAGHTECGRPYSTVGGAVNGIDFLLFHRDEAFRGEGITVFLSSTLINYSSVFALLLFRFRKSKMVLAAQASFCAAQQFWITRAARSFFAGSGYDELRSRVQTINVEALPAQAIHQVCGDRNVRIYDLRVSFSPAIRGYYGLRNKESPDEYLRGRRRMFPCLCPSTESPAAL